jgi:hypothetical protein
MDERLPAGPGTSPATNAAAGSGGPTVGIWRLGVLAG